MLGKETRKVKGTIGEARPRRVRGDQIPEDCILGPKEGSGEGLTAAGESTVAGKTDATR